MWLSEREYAALVAPVSNEDVVVAIVTGVAFVFAFTLICMIRGGAQREPNSRLLQSVDN